MADTDTYANLLSLIEARMGASFGTTEQARVKSLINARAHWCYRESDLWEDFLYIGEERAVDDSSTNGPVVPYTGSAVDAGLTNPYNGSIDTVLRVHRKLPWNATSSGEFEFQGAAGGVRLTGYSVAYGLTKTPIAITNGATAKVKVNAVVDGYTGGTVKVAGVATDTVDINGTHTLTDVVRTSTTTEFRFIPDDTTTVTFSLTGDEEVSVPHAFVTYRARLSGTTYGDGSGETTTVPLAWFEPISLGVYADMLRADQAFGAAQTIEQSARYALQLELERLDAQHAAQTIGNNVHTNLSEQGRAINF